MRGAFDGKRILASDAERAVVAARLDIALEEGRLDLTEYERRSQAAWAAASRADLARLTADLPSVSGSEIERRLAPAPAPATEPVAVNLFRSRRRAVDFLVGLLTGGVLVATMGSLWPVVLVLVAFAVAGGLGWVFWDPYGHRGRRD